MANIADVLNSWNEIGVFSYVIPFLLIFAVVFAILDKTKLLSSKNDKGNYENENKGITAIIAISIALLALQFDLVSTFFATIFPRLGIGISILLVVIILAGFFMPDMDQGKKGTKWVGWVLVGGIVIWSLISWTSWTSGIDSGGAIGVFLGEYIWSIVVLGIVGGVIFAIVRGGKKNPAA
jgi:hypothetical protein